MSAGRCRFDVPRRPKRALSPPPAHERGWLAAVRCCFTCVFRLVDGRVNRQLPVADGTQGQILQPKAARHYAISQLLLHTADVDQFRAHKETIQPQRDVSMPADEIWLRCYILFIASVERDDTLVRRMLMRC